MSNMSQVSEKFALLVDQLAEEVIAITRATSPSDNVDAEQVLNMLVTLNISREVVARIRGMLS